MSNILSKQLSRYVDQLIDAGDDIIHAEAADAFCADNDDLIQQHFTEVVRRMIVAEIKARTQAPAKAIGQGVLFTGLPAAVTVAEGRTKPLKSCTWEDLQVGREFKVDNISFAVEALEAYDEDLETLRPLMQGRAVTIEAAISGIAA